MKNAVEVSPGKPVLIDRFLDHAIEIDVDAISDGKDTIVGRDHGAHRRSRDSQRGQRLRASSHFPPRCCGSGSARPAIPRPGTECGRPHEHPVRGQGRPDLRAGSQSKGISNGSFCEQGDGVPFAKLATKVILGMTLKDLGLTKEVFPSHVSVKESVFPFARFPGVDTLLSPEMKSTGEVMGIDENFGLAFAKAQLAAGQKLPSQARC